MTRAEFTARFPNASECAIRANCSDAVKRVVGPTPPELIAYDASILETSREAIRSLLPPALVPATPRPSNGAARGRTKGEGANRKETAQTKAKTWRVPRTHAGGTKTLAQYWGAVRSALRRAFRYWPPALAALKASRVHSPGPHGRKWLFLCATCQTLKLRTEVEIDHVVPVGPLTAPEHLAGFLQRLTPEDPKAFSVLCKSCHLVRTNAQREARDPQVRLVL